MNKSKILFLTWIRNYKLFITCEKIVKYEKQKGVFSNVYEITVFILFVNSLDVIFLFMFYII